MWTVKEGLEVPANLVSVLIIPGRPSDIWAWQAPATKPLLQTVGDVSGVWESGIYGSPKYSDCDNLFEQLKGVGLNIVRGSATDKTIDQDLLLLLQQTNFTVGVDKTQKPQVEEV